MAIIAYALSFCASWVFLGAIGSIFLCRLAPRNHRKKVNKSDLIKGIIAGPVMFAWWVVVCVFDFMDWLYYSPKTKWVHKTIF
jgi:hypothetical protein